MPKSRPPLNEPFDMALREFYQAKPRWSRYKRLTKLGAEIGDPLAQYAMATWYLHGEARLGVRRNQRKAVALLEQCAPFLGRAAYDLAVCKLRGAGTRRDVKAAFSLYSRAILLGSLAAIEAKADCLALGIGTERDLQAARVLDRSVVQWKRQLDEIDALPASQAPQLEKRGKRRADRPAKRSGKRKGPRRK
jgi:hypothetical protein